MFTEAASVSNWVSISLLFWHKSGLTPSNSPVEPIKPQAKPSRTHINHFSFIGLGEDQPMEIKKPRKPSLFDIGPGFPARQIV